MAKSLFGGWVKVVAVMGVFIIACGYAQAAGEWEWTQGQGWVQGAGVSRPTAKEQLAYAYELEQKGEYMDAARQYFLLIQNFPDASESGVGLQRLAKCLFEMENYYTSYKAIEQVIKSYPNTGRMSDLIEIELRVAKKMLVSQASASVFESDSHTKEANTRRALEVVDAVLEHDPYGPVAPEALLVKGEAHLYINDIAAARTSFDRILEEFPKSDYVERARLGVLRCDSLVGQAKPQEVYDQIQVVREVEADRQKGAEELDEFDNVEESINQLAEVEAAKMMEQAAQYRRMGTHNAVKSAEFLYKEVNRRYPHTPQAEEAREKLGGIKIPREQGRVAKVVKNININPFTWNRDPEPPWIVPQLSPEDTVMIDHGLGPIAGVPETDFPTDGGAGVRPAALDRAQLSASAAPTGRSDVGFSPIDAGPPREVRGEFSSLPNSSGDYGQTSAPFPGSVNAPPPAPLYGMPQGPGSLDLEPPRSSPSSLAGPNPLPSIPESDLVGPAQGIATSSNTFSSSQAPATYQGNVVSQSYPAQNSGMNLGPIPDAALSDLVSPARRLDPQQSYSAPPIQDYYQQPPLPEASYYPEPSVSSGQTYGQAPVMYGNEAPSQGGGWMLDDDFR